MASRKGKQVERDARVLLVAARLAQDSMSRAAAAAREVAERRAVRRLGDAFISRATAAARKVTERRSGRSLGDAERGQPLAELVGVDHGGCGMRVGKDGHGGTRNPVLSGGGLVPPCPSRRLGGRRGR